MHAQFEEAMRRVITGDDASGQSTIIVDGPPSNAGGDNPANLFEIWTDAVSGALDPKEHADLGAKKASLCPPHGSVKVRWFVAQPTPDGIPAEKINAIVRDAFAAIDAGHCVTDQSKHPAMHKTESIDVICVLQGDVSLILDGVETRLKPGNVVIQRGTSHAWKAHGAPALMLAVLIERGLK